MPDVELAPRDTLQQRINDARKPEAIQDYRATLKATFEDLDTEKLVVLVNVRKGEHSMSPSLFKRNIDGNNRRSSFKAGV